MTGERADGFWNRLTVEFIWWMRVKQDDVRLPMTTNTMRKGKWVKRSKVIDI
jgi:hypothetical protein